MNWLKSLLRDHQAESEIESSCKRLIATTRTVEAIFTILMDEKSDEATKKQARFEMNFINSTIRAEVYEIRHYLGKI